MGLQDLLTEDVLRFAVVQELVTAGVSPAHIVTEWRRPGVPDAVDLVLSEPTWTAIEFKFPREPRETNAAWTQHLGEVLKDFYRLTTMPPEFDDRWCVQLLSNRMRRYLDGVAERHQVTLGVAPGEATVLDPDVVRGLPGTALKALSRWTLDSAPTVHARCSRLIESETIYVWSSTEWLTTSPAHRATVRA
ncbi:hypothetical protein [Nocardioides bizhenqiangii]|uniref:Uncharacterized protein n=1 Tax=Nocardioides bizhenqiangii TaxID=3095076 RepID=A0ABZ0ZTK3_9ACTN|nr:hypothetical protein [Nocardioides sp. HM61]WQQ27656.1 hypothetical protein SHK19_05325 [Nocardioides sp. HM61]